MGALLLAVGTFPGAAAQRDVFAVSHPEGEVTPSPAPQPALPMPCHSLGSGEGLGPLLGQGLDGRLHGCFRVGHILPGEHRIAIVELPLTTRRQGDGRLPLRVTPDHARPGATVHLSGEVPAITLRRDYADVCWTTCTGPGLLLEALEVHWAKVPSAHFDIDVPVPGTAWLGTEGPRPLRTGDVTLTIPCLSYAEPCAALVGHLRLEGPTLTQCLPRHPCARLDLSMPAARFGDAVEVGGFAPLTAIIGPRPFGYFLQVDPPPHRTQAKDGYPEFTLAEATLRAEPALPLRRSTPVRLQRADSDQLGTDPADASRLALCAPEGIAVTQNAGASWETVSADGARRDAAASDYPLWPSGSNASPPPCLEVTLDSTHHQSYYAAFSAVPRDGSPPPFLRVGYVTADAGRTWRRVPTPPGEVSGTFAGFQAVRAAILALFFTHSAGAEDGVVVEESRDGGLHWWASQLRCPSTGGCVLFTGTRENRGCAGPLGTPQLVESSVDGRAPFSVIPDPRTVNTCSLAELVTLRDGTLQLLGGDWEYPVLVSSDVGHTWRVRGLPDLPSPASTAWSPWYPDLQLLPDGSLLARGARWELLALSASAWCSVPAQTLSPQLFGRVQVDGPRVWWTEAVEGSGEVQHWRPRSIPLADLRCG